MTISQRIFFELKRQNKTQKQLSDYTGISTSTISAWNKNGTNPSADFIYPIAQFLNVSLEYLLIGEEINTNNSNVINTGNIHGDNNANISLTNRDVEAEKEISSILIGLNFREKTELMTLIYKFADEHISSKNINCKK